MAGGSRVRATLLIMAIFAMQPLAFGGWLALIPRIKESLGLDKAELAIALIGQPVALLIGLQFAGALVERIGPRRIMMAAFPLQALMFALPLLAWDVPSLFLALAFVGLMVAGIEVAMNVYAGRLEKRESLMIMNRCHAFWAVGLMAGSAVLTLSGASPAWLLVVAGLSAAAGVWAARALPRIGDEGAPGAVPRRKLREIPVALFCVGGLMMVVTMTEGAMADWSAIYLAERIEGSDHRAGIAVTVFSAFMAGGRFLGDAIKVRLGAVRHARLTVGFAIAGLLLLVLPLPLPLAFAGFAMAGFGVSAAYPLGVSAVAELDDRYESANIAIMAMLALSGFLLGPPLVGFIAEATGIRAGLAALLPGLLAALWLSRWLAVGRASATLRDNRD